MKKETIISILLGLSLVLLQTACAKRVSSSSQTEGVGDKRGGNAPSETLKEEHVQKEIPAEVQKDNPGAENRDPAVKRDQNGRLVDVYFGFDKALLDNESGGVLEKDGKLILAKFPKEEILIEGHCDERGTDEYNLALGERRARTVKRFLTTLGIDQNRIQTISYGKERPFCDQRDESCYQQNRRAHFVVPVAQ